MIVSGMSSGKLIHIVRCLSNIALTSPEESGDHAQLYEKGIYIWRIGTIAIWQQPDRRIDEDVSHMPLSLSYCSGYSLLDVEYSRCPSLLVVRYLQSLDLGVLMAGF